VKKLRCSSRTVFMVGGLSSLLVLGLAYFLEYWKHLTPCSLCLLQRYVLWTIALVCGVGAIHGSRTKAVLIFYSGLILAQSALGGLLAGRQVWLQHLPPDQVPNCTAGIERLLMYYSPLETLKMVILTSGECGTVDFRVLGLSLAVWSFILFLMLGGIGVGVCLIERKGEPKLALL